MAACRFPEKRERARRLRRRGVSFKRIAAELGVSVSTVHSWTRNIKLTSEQRERNHTGPGAPHDPIWVAKRARSWREKNRRRRAAFQSDGRARARAHDPLHMAGCMLYWAEGAKSRNVLKFASSDAGMVRFFCHFLRRSLGVTSDRLCIRLNVYTGNGLTLEEIETYWLGLLALPRSALRGHTVNQRPTSSSGRKRNKLPYGVCTVSVARSTPELQHIFGAIQEYAGIDEPSWLDGPSREPAKPPEHREAA
jgi:Homeodomain-like domain-containing protein